MTTGGGMATRFCIDAHEHKLRKAGISREAIQAAVRIASVEHAIAVVIEAAADTAQAH